MAILYWCFLVLLLYNIDAAQKSDPDALRKAEARSVIKYQFKEKNSSPKREWKQEDTKELYTRYESKQIYCSIKGKDCWHISLHVHPHGQKQWDRMYVFSYNGGKDGDKDKAFIGAISPFGLWEEKNLVKSEGIQRPKCKAFCRNYGFKKTRTVLIQQNVNKYSIRVDPDNKKELDGMGGAGHYAQWEAIPSEDGKTVQLKSKKTGKYLRMLTKNTIDADGSGKEDPSRWVIHEKDGYVLLESKKYEGKYLAVNKDAKKVVVGKGKKRSQLKLKRQ